MTGDHSTTLDENDRLTTTGRPIVVYIAGSGRSGSTLLERTLGAIPGWVNVGELIDLFRRVAVADELCGCGLAFSACPFWAEVGSRAFGGWPAEVLEEFTGLQNRVARQRRMLGVFARQLRKDPDASLKRYQLLYRTLYEAILETSGSRIVVDASKWPAQALAISQPDLDLRVVNVVRDVRGVAYSMTKRTDRPHAGSSGSPLMDRRNAAETALRWTVCQSEVALLARLGHPHSVLPYEEFVAHPRQSTAHVLHTLGLSEYAGDLAHIGPSSISLPSSHGISGNPSRFAHGSVPLRLDLDWKAKMPVGQRLTATAIAAPVLLTQLTRRLTSTRGPVAETDVSDEDSTREWPLVSVVVTTRGRPELVRETLDSIVGQDYPGEMEILVVHDQEEPDDSLVTEFTRPEREVRVVLNSAHHPGLAGARNTGLDQVRGIFVATSDDDDVWHAGKLRAQLRLLMDDPELLAVGSGIRLIFPGRVVEWRGRSARIAYSTLLRNRVKELHSSTLVMRRETFAKAGTYAENLPHGYAEDYEFLLRVGQAGPIGVVPEPLADIRKDNQSWFLQRSQNTSEALRFLLELHPDLTTTRRGHARILGQIAFAESSMGHRRTALRTAGQALGRYPLAPHAYLAVVQATTAVDPRKALGVARRFGRGLS